ncbi:hypothetical protein BMF94_4639 [Rhodotorula taiwanensis]|uniref:Inhibitor I9 domain-containing protein n=1 Tax=Rhodotorula taiwanensis TaxID=741276 RepID=A0A2S5B6D7_9BASI|nr:hypothetical protein BMF94_4639 [Rhodotorula taiwanensis]
MPNYIVAFKSGDDVEASAIDDACAKVESNGGTIKHKYNSKVMKGFAGSFSDDLKAELEKHPHVKYIEPDSEVTTQ